ncbi:MAG: site-specific integrase [Alphaproteobacteria bacterium]|nr:site-specific integrase [Alphaproteobacteria bacterium]
MFLAIETASRRGELVKLKWADIDFNKSIARLEDTKNGEARDVPLSPLALKILTERKGARGRGEYVFTSQREAAENGHIQPATISRAFRRVRDEIEKEKGHALNLRLHDLRHTAATRWSDDFKNPFDLQAITGHKDIRSLARYVNNKAEQIAAQMKKIETRMPTP